MADARIEDDYEYQEQHGDDLDPEDWYPHPRPDQVNLDEPGLLIRGMSRYHLSPFNPRSERRNQLRALRLLEKQGNRQSKLAQRSRS